MKSYKDSGVDRDGADSLVERIAEMSGTTSSELKARVKDSIGAYAAVYELTKDRWIAASCDGVGTKLLWTLEGMGEVEDLAQDLVAMNVNDLVCVGARPLLFLDYVAFSNSKFLEKGALLDRFIKGLYRACQESECLLVGGETAQMPGFYSEEHFDISGFAVGELAPKAWLQPSQIEEGSRLWAWPSSGPHANGFSWIRKLFDSRKTEDAQFIREHLMSPTRLYVKKINALKALLKEESCRDALQGLYHITGSGYLNLLRAQPQAGALGFVIPEPWALPVWAQEIKNRSQSSDAELYSSLNMGLGMAVVLNDNVSNKLEKKLSDLGLKPLGYSDNKARVKIGDIEIGS